MLSKEDKRRISLFEEAQKYNSYQEKLGLAKELTILRNDFYYQMTSVTEESVSLTDFLYHPLDVLSGDAYSARKVDGFRTFYLLVDGMGKGLSASLTAMIMTSFVNHIIDKMIQHDHFDLYLLVFETMNYIKSTLLEEEALAIDYILIDDEINTISYAKFAMPALFMQNAKNEIIRLKSNNPPMSKYQTDFKVSRYDVSDIDKFLFYSDGVVENGTLQDGKTYAEFIEEDFKNSFTRKELVDNIFAKMTTQEDDLTLAFINKLNFNAQTSVASEIFETSFDEIDRANEWFAKKFDALCSSEDEKYAAGLVFNELFMNAFEHGNLKIDSARKHKLLEEDLYYDLLTREQALCSKKITVQINKITHLSSTYVVTKIIDEGEGFDTQILSEIFRNSQAFNGRGVFISRRNSLGIYYNSTGNMVLYLNKV